MPRSGKSLSAVSAKHVEKHNQVIDRTYALETQAALMDEQIRVANHRIADLEAFHKP